MLESCGGIGETEPTQSQCEELGYKCMTNACNTYTDCSSRTETCTTGSCCTGSCGIAVEICNDVAMADEDGNGLINCKDSTCWGKQGYGKTTTGFGLGTCAQTEAGAYCNDLFDNDGIGAIDCG